MYRAMKTNFLKLIEFLKPNPIGLMSLINLLVVLSFSFESSVSSVFMMCLRKVLNGDEPFLYQLKELIYSLLLKSLVFSQLFHMWSRFDGKSLNEKSWEITYGFLFERFASEYLRHDRVVTSYQIGS